MSYLQMTSHHLKAVMNHKFQPQGGAAEKVRGSPKSVGFIHWGALMSLQSLMAIHPIVVEILQSGP